MRHSLGQLLAASSGREGSAARSAPAEGSPGEEADEAWPRREAVAEDELLFPAGLELDAWLAEAAAAEEDEEAAAARPGSPGEAVRARPGSQRLKAAAAARLNRQRKKQYVQGLESRLQGLAAENRQLRDRNRGLGRRLRRLEREAGYLRAVLANQSALGRLLSRLAGGGALRVGSSLYEEDPEDDDDWLPWEGGSGGGSSSSSDHDYALPVPEEEEEERRQDLQRGSPALPSNPGGVCLHVDRDQVSVEFCSLCARRAAFVAPAAAATVASFVSTM